jgi:hypothetical protein
MRYLPKRYNISSGAKHATINGDLTLYPFKVGTNLWYNLPKMCYPVM